MKFEKIKIIKNFFIIKVIFDDKSIIKSLEQSYLKSKYTNDEDQNGDKRLRSKKFDKQIEGVLGEIAVLNYLKTIFAKKEVGCNVDINRYDDVRTDGFKSPENEYDIKITNLETNKNYYVEVRTSINYKYSFNSKTLENLDTIGTYENPVKQNEKSSDFYIRPLFQLKKPNKDIQLEDISVLKAILDDEIILYLTGGCNRQMMFGELSKVKKMGQDNTEYQTLSIINGWDMKQLSENIRDIVCENLF